MKGSDVWRMGLLSAVWGGSFLFMKVATPEFGPVVLVELRLAIAAGLLVPLLAARGNAGVIWTNRWPLMILGTINSALPFSLLAYATQFVTAGFSSILNATTPFFAAMVAFAWLKHRLAPIRVLGLVVGFCGVVVLVWGRASFKDGGAGGAILAGLGAACSYGVAASFARRRVAHLDARSVSAGSLFWGAIVLLPLASASMPAVMPSVKAWAMVGGLGVLSTALAYLLYFHLLSSLGPTGAVTVTFLVPAFAILWGGVFLHEHVGGRMVAGAATILVGTGLTTGLLGGARVFARRRAEADPAAAAVPAAGNLRD